MGTLDFKKLSEMFDSNKRYIWTAISPCSLRFLRKLEHLWGILHQFGHFFLDLESTFCELFSGSLIHYFHYFL